MRRNELEQKVFEHVAETLFITRADFDQMIKSWMLKPIGETFIWMQKGPEVHFIRIAEGRIEPLKWLELAEGCIKMYGCIIGKVDRTNARALRFIERIGGTRVGADEYDIHIKIERLNHAEHFHRA